jgi:hypothetical protein
MRAGAACGDGARRHNRSALVTTTVELAAIPMLATNGDTYPQAASGTATTL